MFLRDLPRPCKVQGVGLVNLPPGRQLFPGRAVLCGGPSSDVLLTGWERSGNSNAISPKESRVLGPWVVSLSARGQICPCAHRAVNAASDRHWLTSSGLIILPTFLFSAPSMWIISSGPQHVSLCSVPTPKYPYVSTSDFSVSHLPICFPSRSPTSCPDHLQLPKSSFIV